MYTCEITEYDESGLERQRWRFWLDERKPGLRLDSWRREKRPSKRHDFRTVETYDRLRHSRSVGVSIEDVPLPESVKVAALKQFTEALTVEK